MLHETDEIRTLPPNPVAAPSEAPAPELTPTQKEIVQAMSLMKAFGPDHPVTKDMIAERSGAGNGVGENIKKLMTSLKEKGVVESSGSGRGPKSGYWLTELGRNLGEALPRPKR
ncbi:MAG: Rrf2 family transcriptional regulator [Singulisphaera sp.]|nr:Rrf2 family transcriptional regulator [Singulisphaera sp.]